MQRKFDMKVVLFANLDLTGHTVLSMYVFGRRANNINLRSHVSVEARCIVQVKHYVKQVNINIVSL